MATTTAADVDTSEDQDGSHLGTAKRAFSSFRAHGMTDHAATLTYFAMMSLFPGILTAISLLGIFGQKTLPAKAAKYVADHGADPPTAAVIRSTLNTLINSSGGGIGIALFISIVLGLNGASGAFAAAGRALNAVSAVDEDRGFVDRKLTDIAMTLVVILLFAVVIVSLFLGGGIATSIFSEIGLGSTGATIWSIVRWPIALLVAMVAFGVVYAFAPNVQPRRMRWLTAGAVVGVIVWILLSAAFGVYIRNINSVGAAYGAAGSAIALLLWMYISANAFLFGAELNMTLEREQTAGRGGPPMVTPPPSAEQPLPAPTAPASAQAPHPEHSSGGSSGSA